MSGFVVTYKPMANQHSAAASRRSNLSSPAISVSGADVQQITTDRENTAIIDGYVLGLSSHELITALELRDDSVLSHIHGHYCALIIHPNGDIWGHCDRFGARTIYWQRIDSGEIVITSRWSTMPVTNCQWDDVGLGETLRYRCMSEQHTQVAGLSKLPHMHRVLFSDSGKFKISAVARPKSPTKFTAMSFTEKLGETRRALTATLESAACSHGYAAIPLSGGVDSALLAALAKSCFKRCLAVTPAFPGESNPELEIAKTLAQSMGMEHMLVYVDDTRIEENLRDLIRSKGGQVNFHSIAMRQIMEAIPKEFKLVICGDGADTLFGYRGFKTIEKYLRWKRYVDVLPDAVLKLLSIAMTRRGKKILWLKNALLLDVALRQIEIQYDSASMQFIRELYNGQLSALGSHKTVLDYFGNPRQDVEVRELLRDVYTRTLTADHVQEVECAAAGYGKRVYMPFLSKAVMDSAKTLTREQYYGDDYVKPILRDLACEHFDRDLIYRPKQGFIVPYLSWLQGPLAHLVEAVRQETNLFDGAALSRFNVEDHYPIFWSLINWLLLKEEIHASTSGPERFATG